MQNPDSASISIAPSRGNPPEWSGGSPNLGSKRDSGPELRWGPILPEREIWNRFYLGKSRRARLSIGFIRIYTVAEQIFTNFNVPTKFGRNLSHEKLFTLVRFLWLPEAHIPYPPEREKKPFQDYEIHTRIYIYLDYSNDGKVMRKMWLMEFKNAWIN